MAEKAAAPEHRAWEFAPDPFAAKKEVEARQGKKREKDAVAKEANGNGQAGGASGRGSGTNTPVGKGGKEWERAPEVKMASALREMVEATVRKVCWRAALKMGLCRCPN
jgi:ATP-dependent RNA helicase DHX57